MELSTRPSSSATEPHAAYVRAAASHDSTKSAPAQPKSSFFSSSSPTRSPYTSRTTLTTTSAPDLSLDDVSSGAVKSSLPPTAPRPNKSVAQKLTATLRRSITNPFRSVSSTSESISRRSSTNSSATTTTDFSPEMLRLSLAITTRKDSLINSLLSLDGDFVVRIRFLDTVEKFLAEQDNAKQKQMGQKIVGIFFPSIGTTNSTPEVTADNTWFGLSTCVHDHTLKRLAQGQYYPHMIDARNQVLEGMSHSPLVVDVVERTLNSVPKRSTPLPVEPDHD